MSHEISVSEIKINDYILSVTTRDAGDDPKLLEELTYRTIGAWLWIVEKCLAVQVYTFDGGSVEQRYAAEINQRMVQDTDAPKVEEFEFKETFGDSRVTVWDTYRGTKNPQFHLNSDDNPQTAINTWLACQNGIQRALEKWAVKPIQTAPQNPQTHEPSAQATSTPEPQERPDTPKNQPSAPVNGAIVATRAPNSNRVDYDNGQLVSFTVNKIEAGSNKGSAIFKLWTALGTQYPTVTVYMKKTDGNLKPDYEIIKPVIDSLKLSFEKTEAAGNWQLICKVSHVPKPDGTNKEFLNVVSLTAV